MPHSQRIHLGLDRLRLLLGLSIIFVIFQQSFTVGYDYWDPYNPNIDFDICLDGYYLNKDGLCAKSLYNLEVNASCYPRNSDRLCETHLTCKCLKCVDCNNENAWKCLRNCTKYNKGKRTPDRFLHWLNRANWQIFSKRFKEPNYEY